MKKATKVQLEAEKAFVKLNAKWDKLYGPITMVKRRPAEFPKLRPPPGRESPSIRSLSTPGGSTSFRPSLMYSGTAMQGVATMHKSNMVPVFSRDEAKDISSMRR